GELGAFLVPRTRSVIEHLTDIVGHHFLLAVPLKQKGPAACAGGPWVAAVSYASLYRPASISQRVSGLYSLHLRRVKRKKVSFFAPFWDLGVGKEAWSGGGGL